MEDKEKELNDLFLYVKNELKMPIERIGNWLWVDCISESKKQKLLAKGFKFSKTRFKFYYYNQAPVRRYYKQVNFDELRNLYSQNKLVVKS